MPSAPELVKNTMPSFTASVFQLSGQQPAQQRRLQLHKARIVQVEEVLQHAADIRVISPEPEDAIAGEHVQVLGALGIPKIRPSART